MKMKFRLATMTMVLISTGISFGASAASVSGGTVNFKGEVVDAACSVSSDSQDQTVVLDQVRTAKLSTAGSTAGQPKSFNIVLEDCDSSVSQNVSVTFNGQADINVPTALGNIAGAGGATNVALQLFGPDGKQLALGTESSSIQLNDGSNTLPLSVDYMATLAPVSAGAVESVATFSLTYS